MPPALPRPPVSTCALTTTWPPTRPFRSAGAATCGFHETRGGHTLAAHTKGGEVDDERTTLTDDEIIGRGAAMAIESDADGQDSSDTDGTDADGTDADGTDSG